MAAPGKKLFGTDGVRGPVGDFLDGALAMAIGRASASEVSAERPSVLVVRDTRESGPMLETAFASGAAEAGADVYLAGILPTPAAPIIAGAYSFDMAAVISASHNPFGDNGIKLFGPDGRKLSDDAEARIEQMVGDPPPTAPDPGRIDVLKTAEADYLRKVSNRFGELDLSGTRVLLDCANGSTYRVGPEAFRRLGAEVTVLSAEPDGRNINLDCGSTHIDRLAGEMIRGDYTVGFSFDGDGDRVLAVDGEGEVRDGDEFIALVASTRSSAGTLGGGVAVTVMTNYGFHRAMEALGVEVEVTPVGDRHVIEALDARGWDLGGEQSGHLIDRAYAPTGDGIGSALMLMAALEGRPLAEVRAMEKLPQTLVNVRVRDREAFESASAVSKAVEEAEGNLQGRGRVLVRASGTEPLVRVMVEAPTVEEAENVAAALASVVESELA